MSQLVTGYTEALPPGFQERRGAGGGAVFVYRNRAAAARYCRFCTLRPAAVQR